MVLFNQVSSHSIILLAVTLKFKYFYNLYFLLICLSQLIPALRVSYLFTSLSPLLFVLTVTISKEAYDDYKRFVRDKEANSQLYHKLLPTGQPIQIPSAEIRVGDLIVLEKDHRVPADMVLLRTSDKAGSVFIRTDQLDGEIDWKLRIAVPATQKLPTDEDIFKLDGQVYADPPQKDIHSFIGTFTYQSLDSSDTSSVSVSTEPLNVENTLWMNTVIASGNAIGCVIYTGIDTRAVMNTSSAETKTGITDMEINRMTKVLFLVVLAISAGMMILKGFHGPWYVYLVRFIVLFSTIIPQSLRVNLDMAKSFYSYCIMNDDKNKGIIVRTSTLPEELGRVSFLLSDKTGTLTKNDMELKKLHIGTMCYGPESKDDIRMNINSVLGTMGGDKSPTSIEGGKRRGSVPLRGRKDISLRIFDVIQALALCHNVTPVFEDGQACYQASSPDEVAIVKWTEIAGLALVYRSREVLRLQADDGVKLEYEVLHVFPFTSETKRMGIIVREVGSGDAVFFEKGADVMMSRIVQQNDWLDEECGNMAREGLRTLVIGRKRLTNEQLKSFESAYQAAKISVTNRSEQMQRVVEAHLEKDLELLGVTGVEDKLQNNVKMTLESLRNAGIRIWMLTGDKVETATNIAISTRLFARNQRYHQVQKLTSPQEARNTLNFLAANTDCALVIDGSSLQLMMSEPDLRNEFMAACTKLSAVACCRCTPTQKADVAYLIKGYTGKRVCCIGDGGNDVSMIQAADVGVGIVGKEGNQASLAADFSMLEFCHLNRLLLWHGRNSYKRTSKVSLFILHRGFIIAVMQAVFTAMFYFSPIALYQGWIAVGYSTFYTMFPVFSLVLDRDVTDEVAILYPELYKELTKGRQLSFKYFFMWLMISLYQGGVIMIFALFLFEKEFIHIVSITFTALILNELLMVALEVNMWHWLMGVAEISSFLIYVMSIRFLKNDFDIRFTTSLTFFWKVCLITLISFLPLYLFKLIKHFFAPPSATKLLE